MLHGLQGHGRKVIALQLVPGGIHGGDGHGAGVQGFGIPGALVVGETAALHGDGIALKTEHPLSAKVVAADLIAGEVHIGAVAVAQQHRAAVAGDPAVDDGAGIAGADLEQAAEAGVVIDLAVIEQHVLTGGELGGGIAAVIDLTFHHLQGGAGSGIHTHGAAAEELALADDGLVHAAQLHHAADALPRLLGVADGQARQADVLAVVQHQHVGIAGHGREGDLPFRQQGQAVHAADDQLKGGFLPGAENLLPGIGLSVGGLAVVAGLGQVVFPCQQGDVGMGADGRQQFIHIGHGDVLAFRRGHRGFLRRRCRFYRAFCRLRRGLGPHCRGAAAQQQCRRQQQRQSSPAHFSVCHDLFQPFFQIPFLCGEGGGHQGPGQSICSHREQGLPIAPFIGGVHLPQQPFVTAHFTGPVQLPPGDMYHRIEPVHRRHQHREPLEQQVAPAVMGQLMAEDVLQHLLGIRPLRQHQHRPPQPQQHGGAHGGAAAELQPLRAAHLPEQPTLHRRRPAETAAQGPAKAPVAHDVPQQRGQSAGSPEPQPEVPAVRQGLDPAPPHAEGGKEPGAQVWPGGGRGCILLHRLGRSRFRCGCILRSADGRIPGSLRAKAHGERQVPYPGDAAALTAGVCRRGDLFPAALQSHEAGQGQHQPQQHRKPGAVIKGAGQFPPQGPFQPKHQQRHQAAAQGERKHKTQHRVHDSSSTLKKSLSSCISSLLSLSECTRAATRFRALPRYSRRIRSLVAQA